MSADNLRLPTNEELGQVPTAEIVDLAARLLGRLPAEDQAKLAAGVIERLPEGRLPLALFSAYAARIALSTAEFVPLRRNPANGRIDVALIKRSPEDPWWPNAWHLPGVAVLDSDLGGESGEHRYEKIVERIFGEGGEFDGALRILGEPNFFLACLRRGRRGPEQTTFHWIQIEQVPEKPMVGGFFDALDLLDARPPNVLPNHVTTVARALVAVNSSGQSLV